MNESYKTARNIGERSIVLTENYDRSIAKSTGWLIFMGVVGIILTLIFFGFVVFMLSVVSWVQRRDVMMLLGMLVLFLSGFFIFLFQTINSFGLLNKCKALMVSPAKGSLEEFFRKFMWSAILMSVSSALMVLGFVMVGIFALSKM